MPQTRGAAAHEPAETIAAFATFGELLKYLRRRAGLTQAQLGAAVGYSESQIARLESGKRLPDVLAVKTHFIQALDLRFEPELSRQLVDLAGATHMPPAAQPADAGQAAAPLLHNLPLALARLIDRDRDVATLRRLLQRPDVRLVTLLGPPGVGKTSLAVETARAVHSDYADGAWFVSLAAVRDPAMVPAVIAQALELPPTQADPLANLKVSLRARHTLLILDNFEQVLDAARVVAEILASVPRIKVCVTSRTPLRLSGEYMIEVPPLGNAPSVELFIERAQRIRPDLAVDDATRATIAGICGQLDGLPLAIELAAARLRLFSPQALYARLAMDGSPSALDLLSEGSRDLPARQQTLRATITWSYRLLTARQQRLLRTLSVFAGGCALDALQAVEGASDGDAPPLTADLQALVDGSLVQRKDGLDGEPRFSLLVVIREYAAEQLEALGEGAEMRRRHAAYFTRFARTGTPAPEPRGESPLGFRPMQRQDRWFSYLEQEHDNYRQALNWTLRDKHDVSAGVKLAFWRYSRWGVAGDWGDAIYWLQSALAHVDAVSQARDRARILALLSSYLIVANTPRAVELAREAVHIARESLDRRQLLFMLGSLFTVEFEQNNLGEALAIANERLALARELNRASDEALALFVLAEIALARRDLPQAEDWFARSLALHPDEGGVMNGQGTLACLRGDYARARSLCDQSLAAFTRSNWGHGMATVRHSLGDIALFQGDLAQACDNYKTSLRLFFEVGNRQRCTWCLAALAAAAAAQGRSEAAATLWAAVIAIRGAIGTPRPPLRDGDYLSRVNAARAQLDARALAVAEDTGRAMTFEQAVDFALGLHHT